MNYFAIGGPANKGEEYNFLRGFRKLRHRNDDEAIAALEEPSPVHTSCTAQVESLNYRIFVSKKRLQRKRSSEYFEEYLLGSLGDSNNAQYAFITLDNGLYARTHHTCQ